MKYLCAPLFFAGLVIMGMLLAGELQALDEPLSIEELKSAVYPSQSQDARRRGHDLGRVLIVEAEGIRSPVTHIGARCCEVQRFDGIDILRELYQVGYTLAVKGYPWLKKPPGL
jgi:hypothetical protein